jgi:2',3'-cyclic-nucleotide 2'-phosphodiesterase
MKILFIGEIVAEAGRKAVKKFLPEIKKEYGVDLVLANAENLAGGRGVTEETLAEMQSVGIDYFTSGDHTFWQKGTEDIIDELPVLIPANYPEGTPGKGYEILDTGKNGKILLMNLMGRTSFGGTFSYLDDPFKKADEILEKYKDEKFTATIIDFHAEASSEKVAFGFYLDGRVTAIVGSHTHVPTCDNRALPKGTLYVSDMGMTGSIDSVLGVETEIIINVYKTARQQRFEWETAGAKAFRSVLLDTENKSIIRVDKIL